MDEYVCQKCLDVAVPCFYPKECEWPDDEPDAILCESHARELGFCPRCGEFVGGIDGIEFLQEGYCDDCWQDLSEFWGDDDLDEDDEGELLPIENVARPNWIPF